ncbi:hypothetical protein Hypma_010687 [Hypsizygus marmoreus]|uniref:Uncharacterized protein n=1 Tax=Hypsizygus marmoreus TaxID=39966 RepID=A0A369JJC5_HYPMA|nr:hypothetical protein Hypma_010687 [Hypsizygus marmoreus]
MVELVFVLSRPHNATGPSRLKAARLVLVLNTGYLAYLLYITWTCLATGYNKQFNSTLNQESRLNKAAMNIPQSDSSRLPPPHGNHGQTNASQSRLSSISGSFTKVFKGRNCRRTADNIALAHPCPIPASHSTAAPFTRPSEAPSQPHVQPNEPDAAPAGPTPQIAAPRLPHAPANNELSTGGPAAQVNLRPPSNVPRVGDQNIVNHGNDNGGVILNSAFTHGLSTSVDANSIQQLWMDSNGFLRVGPSQTGIPHSTVTLLVTHLSIAAGRDRSGGSPTPQVASDDPPAPVTDDVGDLDEVATATSLQSNNQDRCGSPPGSQIHGLQDNDRRPTTPARSAVYDNDNQRLLSSMGTSHDSQSSISASQVPTQGQNEVRADDQATVHNHAHVHIPPTANTSSHHQPASVSQDYPEPRGLPSRRQQGMALANQPATLITDNDNAIQESDLFQVINPQVPPGAITTGGNLSHHLTMGNQGGSLPAGDQLLQPLPNSIFSAPPPPSLVTFWPPQPRNNIPHPSPMTQQSNSLPFTRPAGWESSWKRRTNLAPRDPLTVDQCLYIFDKCRRLQTFECTLNPGGRPQHAGYQLRFPNLLNLHINTSVPPSNLLDHLLLPDLRSLDVRWNAPGRIPELTNLGIHSLVSSSTLKSCPLRELVIIGLCPPENELLDCLSLLNNTLRKLVVRSDPDLHPSNDMMISRKVLSQLTLCGSTQDLCPKICDMELSPVHAMDNDYLAAMRKSRNKLTKTRFLMASG